MQNSLDTVATFFWNVYLIIKISYFKFIKGRDERPQTTLAHSQQQRSFVCALLLSFVSFPQSSKAQMSVLQIFRIMRVFLLFCFDFVVCFVTETGTGTETETEIET